MTGTQAILAVIGILATMGGVIVGVIIGFYKCKADLSEQYVSKDDCQTCSVKKQMAGISQNMREASEELKKGSKTFTTLKVSMAVIAEELKVKDKVQSMLESMGINDT